MISYRCEKCGAGLESPESNEGCDDTCPICNASCRVPLQAITYKCPSCGAKLESPGELAGGSDCCPKCQQTCSVPQSKRQKAEEQQRYHQQAEAERRKVAEEKERAEARRLEAQQMDAQRAAHAEQARREAKEMSDRLLSESKERARSAKEKGRTSSQDQIVYMTTLVSAMILGGLFCYFVWVRPLKEMQSKTMVEVMNLRDDLASLTRTVNNNADVANYNNRLR